MYLGVTAGQRVPNLPKEYAKDHRQIRAILEAREQDQLTRLSKLHEETKPFTDKEIGLRIRDLTQQGRFQTEYESVDRTKANPVNYLRRAFFEFFRPTDNILEGYTPSASLALFDGGA